MKEISVLIYRGREVDDSSQSVEAPLVPSPNVRVLVATSPMSDVNVSGPPFTIVSDDRQHTGISTGSWRSVSEINVSGTPFTIVSTRSPSDGNLALPGWRLGIPKRWCPVQWVPAWVIDPAGHVRWSHVMLLWRSPHRRWRLEVLMGGCSI